MEDTADVIFVCAIIITFSLVLTGNGTFSNFHRTGKKEIRMASQTLVVLNEIPCFKGRPMAHDVEGFKYGPDLKTFLRTLQNHFLQQDIKDDAEKLQLLYSRVDKTSGDAITLLNNLYVGRHVKYDDVEKELVTTVSYTHLTLPTNREV